MNTNTPLDAEHTQISEAYTKALARSKAGTGGCCGPAPADSGDCCAPTPAGVAAKLANYDSESLHVPEEAVRSSFGCGNPLAFQDVEAGQVVLDLGSGAGLDLLVAAEKVGHSGQVIGVDMTDSMIAEAEKNIERAGASNVEVRKGVIEALPVEDASVDWVISNCVINLAPVKQPVFDEIQRVLKPGGRFSISDIVVEGLPEEFRGIASLRSACVGGAISEEDYLAGLRQAGLEDVKVLERLVYETDQLAALTTLDEAEALELAPGQAENLVERLGGKVWSAKFAGRRAR